MSIRLDSTPLSLAGVGTSPGSMLTEWKMIPGASCPMWSLLLLELRLLPSQPQPFQRVLMTMRTMRSFSSSLLFDRKLK